MDVSGGGRAFQILTVLLDEPLHGYAIVRAVAELSANGTKLSVSTLYAALDRLIERGLVAADREEVVNGRLRRYYRITDAGVGALSAQATQMADQASHTLRRIAARRPATGGIA